MYKILSILSAMSLCIFLWMYDRFDHKLFTHVIQTANYFNFLFQLRSSVSTSRKNYYCVSENLMQKLNNDDSERSGGSTSLSSSQKLTKSSEKSPEKSTEKSSKNCFCLKCSNFSNLDVKSHWNLNYSLILKKPRT